MTRRPYRLKRAVDLLGATLLLPLALPLLAACAIAVRLDSPGHVVFRQARTGRDGRRFTMYKFRTMVQNAEELKAGLAHLNILAPPDFKIIDDPRMTRVGSFLRRTSLDELPQLINVFRGEMSLVGPRPTSFAATTYRLWHAHRLDLAPGITGLWQVTARNESSFDERVRLDIEYARTISLWMDLKIIALTALAVVKGSGA